MKEVSITEERVDELELLKKQSTTKDSMTPACIEMKGLGFSEKLPESHEEIKSLPGERDNLKMKEAVQAGQDQLKEDIRESLAKVSFILSFHLISVLPESSLWERKHLCYSYYVTAMCSLNVSIMRWLKTELKIAHKY